MAQIIPFPADAEEPELEALSREALLALAQELREKLAHMDVGSVAMSQESIAEAIAPRQWYNPASRRI